ncbi:unnamed protein product, partial [Ectocarpus sp. 4 AP-2014]
VSSGWPGKSRTKTKTIRLVHSARSVYRILDLIHGYAGGDCCARPPTSTTRWPSVIVANCYRRSSRFPGRDGSSSTTHEKQPELPPPFFLCLDKIVLLLPSIPRGYFRGCLLPPVAAAVAAVLCLAKRFCVFAAAVCSVVIP